jgi:hypothetical protein
MTQTEAYEKILKILEKTFPTVNHQIAALEVLKEHLEKEV